MPISPWSITETYSLIEICSQIKPPSSYLTTTFFPNRLPVSYSSFVSVEYSKQGRQLAPYIVRNTKGVNINRAKSRIVNYKPPLVGPRRVIGLGDIELRQIGEQPIFSNVRPEERAARMQANDLVELLRMIENRKNKQAADILQYGRTTIKGFADDGVTVEEDEIIFDDWNGRITPKVKWDQAGADIYGDLRAASERIQEDAGILPTLAVCGKNVEQYLLNNTEIFKWLSIPNRENLTMVSFQPHYTSPQCRFIGYINALNLELVSYMETFTDDDGQLKPFIDPDAVILGVPGTGRQLFGAVTWLDNAGNWQTAAAENLPMYSFDSNAQQTSLTILSRFLLVPATFDSHLCLSVH